MLEAAGEEMLESVEEEKQTLVEEMEAKAQEQLEEIRRANKKASDATVKILRSELQEASVARGKAEASLRDAEATISKLEENISMLESAGEDVLKAVEEEKQMLTEKVLALEKSLEESEGVVKATNAKLATLAGDNDPSLRGDQMGGQFSSVDSSNSEVEAKFQKRLAAMTEEKKSVEGELQCAISRAVELEDIVEKNKALLEDVSSKLQATSNEKNELEAAYKNALEDAEKAQASLVK